MSTASRAPKPANGDRVLIRPPAPPTFPIPPLELESVGKLPPLFWAIFTPDRPPMIGADEDPRQRCRGRHSLIPGGVTYAITETEFIALAKAGARIDKPYASTIEIPGVALVTTVSAVAPAPSSSKSRRKAVAR